MKPIFKQFKALSRAVLDPRRGVKRDGPVVDFIRFSGYALVAEYGGAEFSIVTGIVFYGALAQLVER
ncbi:MAG: hypothetical protein LBJ31_02000 [Treponema sp.]|nr:hypothetical protein [Treponema sp.]